MHDQSTRKQPWQLRPVPSPSPSSSSPLFSSQSLPTPLHRAHRNSDKTLSLNPISSLRGALGYGLDSVAPNLTLGGPPPIGARKANLDPLIRDIITQFAYQEVGHLRFLVAGLLGVESAQDAVIRALLYQQAQLTFTNKISELRNQLGHAGIKDEGIIVPPNLGAEGKIAGNIIVGNEYSISYDRTPEEILRIVYGSGCLMERFGRIRAWFMDKTRSEHVLLGNIRGIGGVRVSVGIRDQLKPIKKRRSSLLKEQKQKLREEEGDIDSPVTKDARQLVQVLG
ncbi:hypothetical protein NE237_010832 [Protea cynaroides]|uniref:Uncharacterized protein n=1 Tax=Protea cynaroides TaxID=273540 RepID=A0A9Q0R200_9MAGN|nr:hypothetical protein NE237_010832 [Protea cynaroides]